MGRARPTCAVLLLCLGGAPACGEEREVESGRGVRCERDDDCNRSSDGAVVACGILRLCVRGFCEADAGARALPCGD